MIDLIISASRRTDIPAFYSDWFYSRLKAGYVCTRNPFNPKQIRKISLKKEDVTCFVFWTKNPEKFSERLEELEGYDYYFQFTLTSYGSDVEPNLPEKDRLIDNFIALSKKIGKEKIVWRYDPILINEKYTKEYHFREFARFAEKLHSHTEKCIISFVDMYKNTKKAVKTLGIKTLSPSECLEIAAGLSSIADKYALKLEACSEDLDLSPYFVSKAKCVDTELIERLTRKKLIVPKDRHQRKECGCASSVDIGAYNTCPHRCLYCYANFNENLIRSNLRKHDPSSPFLLCGIGDD